MAIDGDEMTLTLSSPITEEQFDAITDVDFDNTDRIWFHTKHGKDVEFVKRKKGKWIMKYKGSAVTSYKCSECGRTVRDDTGYDVSKDYPFCHCGADMREDQHDQSKR